jgi:putative ABC transport system permease protein
MPSCNYVSRSPGTPRLARNRFKKGKKLFRYLLKSLWRHRMRTSLTVLGAAVSMFVFCFVAAFQDGLNRLTDNARADRYLITFQENRFCPSTSRIPENYASEIRRIEGVEDVIPIQVWTNNCRASLDVIVFNGITPDQIRAHRPIELVDGSWEHFSNQTNAALVGVNVARKRRLSVGNQFTIGGLSVTIAGIFKSLEPADENLIFTSLAYLQFAHGTDAAGLVTQHEVFLKESADPEQVSMAIDTDLRNRGVRTKTRRKSAFMAHAVSDLVDLIRFSNWLGYACVGLVLSIVATTTVMSVQDRMKEYAVLQTIGVRPWRAMRLVIAESEIVCLFGGCLGMGLAVFSLYWFDFSMTAEGVTIPVLPSMTIVVTTLVISALIGLVAGLTPGIQVARLPLVKALRQE